MSRNVRAAWEYRGNSTVAQRVRSAATRLRHSRAPADCVEHEQPYQAIIKTAEDNGCDAIAMASHGRSGIAAVLPGSVTNKVLTHSSIPVLVYR